MSPHRLEQHNVRMGCSCVRALLGHGQNGSLKQYFKKLYFRHIKGVFFSQQSIDKHLTLNIVIHQIVSDAVNFP